MRLGPKLEIDNTLCGALESVMGALPAVPTPVEVLSAFAFSLVKDLGLSESDAVDPADHERPPLPAPMSSFIHSYLPTDNDDALRDALYDVFVSLSGAPGVGKALNGNQPLGQRNVLLLAQTAWNLERNHNRPQLPLVATETAEIPHPASGSDLAQMGWTQRSNLKNIPGRSSGDAFRKQTARLAVLVARHLIDSHQGADPELRDAQLDASDRGQRIIVWTGATEHAGPVSGAPTERGPILVGDFAEIGGLYERRALDSEIERIWADEGSQRIWLRGGPGLGKSYAARRVMQEALARRGDSTDELLIWVDNADAASVTRALAAAAQRIPAAGITIPPEATDPDDRLAQSLLERLRTTDRNWLIIFDDARADELISQQLLPPATNPYGRVLITTLGDSDADAAGRQILAEQFTPAEADRYLSARLPHSSADDRRALALNTDYHPLVLSVATATIAAERMRIADWLTEFRESHLDEAADHPDMGGYPHPITATWRVALAKAAQGEPADAVERAALIAAIQDPAGHPTWLWHRDTVAEWVDASGAPARRGRRIHPAARRLIDFGILELRGDWNEGRVSIHQMAARAVRETADPAALAEIAAILTKEWVLQLTAHPELAGPTEIRAAIDRLCSLTGLDSFTQDALAGLMEFSAASLSAVSVAWSLDWVETIEPYLLRGGPFGLADLAEEYASIGRESRALGGQDAARRYFTDALEICEQLDRSTVDDEQRAETLGLMAELNEALGSAETAQEQRLAAVRIRERLADAETPQSEPFGNLLELVDLSRLLGDDARSSAALDRSLAELTRRQPTDTVVAASEHAKVGRRLAAQGRTTEAIETMRRAHRLYEQSERGGQPFRDEVRRELGMLYAQQRDWARAERWLERGKAPRIVLASAHLHADDQDAARSSLSDLSGRSPTRSAGEGGEPLPGWVREAHEGRLGFHFAYLTGKALRRRRWEDAATLSLIHLEIVTAQANADSGHDPEELAAAYVAAGQSAWMAQRNAPAVELLGAGVKILDLLAELDLHNTSVTRRLASALTYLSVSLRAAGSGERAVITASRAVELLGALEPAESASQLDIALSALAVAHSDAGAVDDALEVSIRRADLWRGEEGSEPAGASLDPLADALQATIGFYLRAGRAGEAIAVATELVQLRRAGADHQPGSREAQAQLADALVRSASVHGTAGRGPEAETLAREGVTVRTSLLDSDPSASTLQADLSFALAVLGGILSELDRTVEAIEVLVRASSLLQLPAELDPPGYMSMYAGLLFEIAIALRKEGRDAEADGVAARVADLKRRYPDLMGDSHAD